MDEVRGSSRRHTVLTQKECRRQALAFWGWYTRVGEDLEGAFERWAGGKDFVEGDLRRIWNHVVALRNYIPIDIPKCHLLLEPMEVKYILEQHSEIIHEYPQIFKNGLRRGRKLWRGLR